MSKKTQILTHGLLSGEINGAALQGALENGGFLGAWLSLLQNRDIEELLRSQTALDGIFGSAIAIESVLASNGAVFAASDSATAALAGSSSAMVTIVSDVNLLNHWNNTPANKTRLQNLINQSGSCLVRYEITDGPNWTPPDGALVTASVFMIGGGGGGGNGGYSGGGGGGGGGGESRTFQLPFGIPASSQSVTIGSSSGSSTNTVFQSQTALTGNNGTRPNGGSGAGTTTSTFYDTDATTALWQPTPAGRRGGNGGGGGSSGNGSAGSDGLTGSGGAGGPSYSGGSAGTGFGSGGGGGGPGGPAVYYDGLPGGTADSTAYGSGGGGGGGGGSSGNGGSGGNGRQGIIIVYGVLGAPKP